MSIDEFMAHACIGDEVLVDARHGMRVVTGVQPGVYFYQGMRGSLYGPELYFSKRPDGQKAERITATWLARACYTFEFARAVSA